jgi:choline dehydrogenase-like flavoprotein
MKPLDYTARDHLGHRLHTAETLAGRKHGGSITLTADAVIVGAGPAGLSAAKVLAERGLDVVVLEAGSFWKPDEFQRDQAWATTRMYQEDGARVSRGNSMIPVASGHGVGGGTLVNSGICFRAPDHVLDEWVDSFGADIWRRTRRTEQFEHVEQAIGVDRTNPAIAGRNSEIARDGFGRMESVEHGYMPRNTPGCSGCGACNTGCPVGGKASADLNWLPAFLRNDGQLYADTRVESLTTDGSDEDVRVTGVRGVTRDPETDEQLLDIEVSADRVILACGAIFSPVLLKQHRLGDEGDHLGEHLHMHPGGSVMAKMPDTVHIWDGATQGYYAHHPNETDIIAETYSAPLEALFSTASEIGIEAMDFLHDLDRMAACGAIIRDQSEGTVSPGANNKADIVYRISDRDFQLHQRGYQFVIDMFFEAGAEQVKPLVNGAEFTPSRNRAHQYVSDIRSPDGLTLYASHPMGTCRMHADPEQGVVRPDDGAMHAVEGLHIVDASVLPTALGVNPQVTIMATAIAMARQIS